MLSKPVIDKLNQQINLEFYSSNFYLQMSSWCDHKALPGASMFLRNQAGEEMRHMQRLFTYVNETGAMALLGDIEAPPSDFESIVDIFKRTYEHETKVTQRINELVHTAFQEKDYSTFNFLQWYVAEQHEEEKLFKTILDKIDMIGTEGEGIFYIDQELAEIAKSGASKGVLSNEEGV